MVEPAVPLSRHSVFPRPAEAGRLTSVLAERTLHNPPKKTDKTDAKTDKTDTPPP